MQKNEFKKYFFKLINNAVFGKTMEKVTKHKNIELVTNEARRIYLVSERKYHTTSFFWKVIIHRNEKKTYLHE